MDESAPKAGITSYFRRLAPTALVAFCFFVLILFLPPSRTDLFSGTISWRRLMTFAAFLVLLSFAAAALLDWDELRKRRKTSRD